MDGRSILLLGGLILRGRGWRRRGHAEGGHARHPWHPHTHHGDIVGGVHWRWGRRRCVHHARGAWRRWRGRRGGSGRQRGLDARGRWHHGGGTHGWRGLGSRGGGLLGLLPGGQGAGARAGRGGGVLLPWQRRAGRHAACWGWRWSLLLPWWQRSRRRGRRLVARRRRGGRHHAHWRRQQTHRVAMRSWSLAHWGRRRLHPGGRQAIGVRRHGRPSHVWHGWREAVWSSRASWSSVHAVEVSVLGRAGAHPGGPVRWWLGAAGC